MFELTQRKADIFRSWVNPVISLMFVGSFSLGAFLIVYNTAFGKNPIAEAFATALVQRTTLPDK
ncbi:hypothetical protein K2Q00_00435 [Patescibacteria group bacterium]|nr:hypothetical protein [Patescibacteria group bacterium]